MTRGQITKAWGALRNTGLDPAAWVLLEREPVPYPGRRGLQSLRAFRFRRSARAFNYKFRHRGTGKRITIPGGWAEPVTPAPAAAAVPRRRKR